ncbi:MAG: hypothetical protein U9N53_07775 [Bacteroidota bacterium]|nr:hypothetical protein [Bacteroidota bacterium]
MENQANSPELKKFIQKSSNLFWYIPEDKKQDISLGVLVETILNYGSRESVRKLFELIGIEKASEVFKEQIKNKRNNYFKPVRNFFELYFARHA